MSVSPSQWQEEVLSPIRRGALTPNQEAFSLLARFASGSVRMDGDVMQHLPITQGNKCIGSTLSKLPWLILSTKKTDGSVTHSKKAKIAKITPKQTKANKLAQKQPCTRIPNSDIKIENIIPGSPIYIPYKNIKVTSKGKHSKKIKLINETDKPVGMAHTKLTLTRKEWDAIAARAKCATDRAKKLATKQTQETNKALSTPKSIPNCKTVDGGKTPHKKLATKTPRKKSSGAPKKPRCNWEMHALWGICRFQKSVGLLIPLLSFQHVVREVAQDFRLNLRFTSSAILALQEAAETFLVQLFESVNLCTIHHNHQTIAQKDFYLVCQLWHITGINLWWVS